MPAHKAALFLAHSGDVWTLVLGVVVMAWIVCSNWSRAARVRQREQTRRHLADYIARGLITHEDVDTLNSAGGLEAFEEKVHTSRSAGEITAECAREMLRVAYRTACA